MSTPLEEFVMLSRRAAEDLDATHSVRSMEPSLLEMLRIVHDHPELRGAFEQAFIDLCDSPSPKEIVQFCMRELQWSAVKEHVAAAMRATKDTRFRSTMQQVLDVYDDEWPDADLWEYYSERSKG